MSEKFMIGALAKRAKCKVQTIRYYEDIGIMPAALRAANNRRIYTDSHLERLTFIRHSRELGFSLDDIRALLSLSDVPDQTCADIDTIARNHLAEVNEKISSLMVLKAELERMVTACAGGSVSDCQIIKLLSDHRLCQNHGQD